MVGDKIVTTTTVTVDQNGHTHAKAILESQAATFGELQEKVKFILGVMFQQVLDIFRFFDDFPPDFYNDFPLNC